MQHEKVRPRRPDSTNRVSGEPGAVQCVAFADTWEPQPHHTSEVAAANSIHGRLTVCSLYLFAICTRLFFDYEKPLAVLTMLGKNEIVLPNPAHPGDRLYYRTRCTAKRPSQSRPGTGIVTLEDNLSTEPSRLVLNQKVTLLVAQRLTRPGSDGPAPLGPWR